MPILASISGLPDFLIYIVTAAGLVGLYLVTYMLATAHNELALIRKGVAAASLASGASLLGFALPLSSAIIHAQGLLDCAIWGLVAIVVQIAVYWAVRLALPDLTSRIQADEMSAAIFLGSASLAAGAINAAAMSY